MKILSALFACLVISQISLVAQNSTNHGAADARLESPEAGGKVKTEWIGHRGSRGPFVQNTTEAFLEGVERGYYALEMDLRVSSDGVFYICHDDYFLPYLFTDATLYEKFMGGYTWADLKDLEIKNTRNNPKYFSTLDLFEDYLQSIKDNDVEAIIDEVDQRHQQRRYQERGGVDSHGEIVWHL